MMTPQGGDVLLNGGHTRLDRAIRWAEARRYGKDSLEASVNHAALFETPTIIIESTDKGVVRNTWVPTDNDIILRPPYPVGGAELAVAAAQARIGIPYGYLTDVSLAIVFLTQTRLRFGMSGELICSGGVSLEVMQGGVSVGTDSPEYNSPADIIHVYLGSVTMSKLTRAPAWIRLR